MKPFLKVLAFTGFVFLLFSCSHENPSQPSDESPRPEIEVSEIPLEDALTSLQEFMSDAYPEKLTKAGSFESLIESVAVHQSKTSLTKVGTPTIDAYIVNFIDDGGFAVLGAKTDLGDIIAVTEGGSITPKEIDSAYDCTSGREEVLFYDEEGNAYTSYYCEEDDDYYCAGNFCLPVLIYNALDSDSSGRMGSGGSGSGGSGLRAVAPLLKTRWSQGQYHESGVYNKYCKVLGNNMYTGCSTTALAQIIAYNRFPERIRGIKMDYENITSVYNAYYLDDCYAEQVSILFGDIFDFVSKASGSFWTMITPEQIKIRMKSYGYKNVDKINGGKEFSRNMLNDVSNMLCDGKPVFFSALPFNIFKGHSWVIDGAMYSSNREYLLHFNFGWSGSCNGYFSPSCMNPAKSYGYDMNNNLETLSDHDHRYKQHYRMITYDF